MTDEGGYFELSFDDDPSVIYYVQTWQKAAISCHVRHNFRL